MTATPSSCHVQILSANGAFNADIFHVKICGGASTSRHFIGIAADHQEKDSVKADDTSGHDMKFLLGCSAGPENLQRNDRESISTRFWQDMEEISSAKLLVDAMAPEAGFVVKTASFEFAELPVAQREKLPNLLEWVEPRCRQRVLIWVQDIVNAQYGGKTFTETLPGVKFFCPGAEGGLLQGHLHMLQLQTNEKDEKESSSENEKDENSSGESEQEVSMQLLIEVKDFRKF